MQSVLATQILRGSLASGAFQREGDPSSSPWTCLALCGLPMGKRRLLFSSAQGADWVASLLKSEHEQETRIGKTETRIASFPSCETNCCIGKHGIWVREAVGVALPSAGS